MRKLFILLTISFVFLNVLNSQERDSLIEKYLALAEVNLDSAKFDKALDYNLRALNLVKLESPNADSIKGNIFTNLAFLYLEKNNYKVAQRYFNQTLELRLDTDGPNSRSVVKAYINLGFYNDELTYYNEAINYYNKAWDILKKISDDEKDPLFAVIYNNLAICYGNKTDIERAILFFKKSLALDISLYGENHIDVAIDYHNIGSYYHDLKEYDLSLEYYNKSLVIYLANLADKHPNVISLYIAIGLSHYHLEEFETAMFFYNKVLGMKVDNIKEYQGLIAKLYMHLGDVNISLNLTDKGLNYYNKARFTFDGMISSTYFYARILTKTGTLYTKQKKYQKALRQFQLALKAIDNSAQGEFSFQKARSPKYLLNIYQAQTNTLFSYYLVNRDSTLLHNANKAGELAIQLIEFMKSSYRESESKQMLVGDYYPIFEKAIEVKFKLWEISKDSSYLHQAFELAEKSKGSLLLEAISKSNAEKFAGIPDSLLEQEELLKIEIAFFEKLLFDEEYNEETVNVNRINELNSKIFDLKLKYEKIVQQFEIDFPQYYQLKYSLKIRTIEELRYSALDYHQGLLEYFVGDSTIFVFAIDRYNFNVIRLKKDFPLEDWTRQLHNCISRYNAFSSTADSLKQLYIDLSYQLYEKLFQPLLPYCPPRVIIIPDGVISYLPFEALLSKKPDDIYYFKNYQYLLNDYTISYSYSASLLSEKVLPNEKEIDLRKNLLGFAPEFKSNKLYSVDRLDGLIPLKYNTEEVESLQKMVGGTIFIGQDATESNFIKVADQYKILHLATHGKANDKVGDYSYLAFTEVEDSLENELLYVKDIYNLKLKADLVVLSACETAIGDLQRGEGMVSLARSFSYAGTPSILPTLWQISDAKAVQMMELFYKRLQEGKSKDDALRSAKLAYIKGNANLANHPFFWASYIIIGNTQPVNLPKVKVEPTITTNASKKWWLGLPFVAFLLFFLNKKKFKIARS